MIDTEEEINKIIESGSLLGVKYILSEFPVAGLVPLTEMGTKNNKVIYENPYCLPFALRYNAQVTKHLSDSDPFVFQNQLYSQLLGKETAVYIPVPYEMELIQTEGQSQTVRYSIELPQGNYACYGNLPYDNDFNGTLNVNDSYTTGYARWLSPSVFYIPVEEGATDAVVSLDFEGLAGIAYGTEQFYILDLDTLAEVSSKLSAKKAESISIENGEIILHDDSLRNCIDTVRKTWMESTHPMATEMWINFELLVCHGYDAIQVLMDHAIYWKLYGWDVDSILIFNPDCIVEVK